MLKGKKLLIWRGIILVVYLSIIFATLYLQPENIKLNSQISYHDIYVTFATIILAILFLIFAHYKKIIKLKVNFGIKKAALAILFLGLIMAPAEEIIFRGFLGTWIAASSGVFVSIIITSLLFGLLHLPKSRKLTAFSFIGGLIFSLVYFNTSSIIHPIIVHLTLGFLYFYLIK